MGCVEGKGNAVQAFWGFVLALSATEVLNDAGKVTEVIELASGSECVSVSILIGQWQSARVLESGTVIMDCKDGAYEPLGPEDILEVAEK